MAYAIPITAPITESDMRRFWAKVALPDENGCLLWTAAEDHRERGAYGAFDHGGRTIRAHRFAYTALVGPIPDGLVIDHVRDRGCVSRLCVAPDHLEPVTHAENVRRGERTHRGHCPQGHPYSGENLYVSPQGHRRCRACNAARSRALKAAKRVAKSGVAA